MDSRPGKQSLPLGEIARIAGEMMGKPYHLGGFGEEGFDCLSMVYYFYSSMGIELPIEFEGIAFEDYRIHASDMGLFSRFLHSLGEKIPRVFTLPGDLAIIEPTGETHPAIVMLNGLLLMGSVDLGIIQAPLRLIKAPISFRRIIVCHS